MFPMQRVITGKEYPRPWHCEELVWIMPSPVCQQLGLVWFQSKSFLDWTWTGLDSSGLDWSIAGLAESLEPSWLGVYNSVKLGPYMRVYWGVYLRVTQRWTWVCTQWCALKCIESRLGNIQETRLRESHQVQLEVYLKVCSEVCSKASWELTCQCTVKQAGIIPFSAIRSVLESMPGSVRENVLEGEQGRILGVYLGASLNPTFDHRSSWLGVRHRAQFGAYSQAGWNCAIECNQQFTLEHSWVHAMPCIWQLAFILYAA